MKREKERNKKGRRIPERLSCPFVEEEGRRKRRRRGGPGDITKCSVSSRGRHAGGGRGSVLMEKEGESPRSHTNPFSRQPGKRDQKGGKGFFFFYLGKKGRKRKKEREKKDPLRYCLQGAQ